MVRLLHFTLNNSKQEKHSLKRVSLVLSSGGSMIRRKSGLGIDYLFSLSHVVPFFSFIIFFLHLLSLSSPLLSLLPSSPFLLLCASRHRGLEPLAAPGSATGFKGSQFFCSKAQLYTEAWKTF